MSSDDAERLLLAMRHFRGDEGELSRQQAEAILGETIPRLLRSKFRAQDWEPSDALEEATAVAIEKAWRGSFRGDTPGEAVEFVRRCAYNQLVDAYRHARRWKAVPIEDAPEPPQSDEEPIAERRDLEQTMARIESLRRLILIKAGRRKERVEVFLDYRLGRGKPPPKNPGTVEARRERDRIYQARCVGRRYAAKILEELIPQLSEQDRQLGAVLVSALGLEERPENECEEKP